MQTQNWHCSKLLIHETNFCKPGKGKSSYCFVSVSLVWDTRFKICQVRFSRLKLMSSNLFWYSFLSHLCYSLGLKLRLNVSCAPNFVFWQWSPKIFHVQWKSFAGYWHCSIFAQDWFIRAYEHNLFSLLMKESLNLRTFDGDFSNNF